MITDLSIGAAACAGWVAGWLITDRFRTRRQPVHQCHQCERARRAREYSDG